MTFCPKCGKEIVENASYCISCGHEINFNNDTKLKHSQYDSLPKQEVVMTKSKSWGSKVQLGLGVIVIFSAIYFSNPYQVILGSVFVIIGFVNLKNKSKTIDQFLTIVTFIMVGILLINGITSLSSI